MDSIPLSLQAFLRAYLVGFGAETIPKSLPLLIKLLTGKKNSGGLSKLLDILSKGFAKNGLAMSAGISIGGAHVGQKLLEPLVRVLYLASLEKNRIKKLRNKGVDSGEGGRRKERENTHNKRIKIITTFISSTLSSLVAISVLQSSATYTRPRPANPIAANYIVQESPTLDLTLFLFVRAFDTILRGGFEAGGVTDGRRGRLPAFIAAHTDTIIFQLACFRIMWCWFFAPSLLPPSYVKWICGLARGDPALMQLSRLAKSGAFKYDKEPIGEVKKAIEGITATMLKISSSNATLPVIIDGKLTCRTFHGTMNTNSCEYNSLARWVIGFGDAFKIYGLVHLVPQLLFNSRGFLSSPLPSIAHVVLAASRSSAFLTTFITSIYATTCLIRTRIGSKLFSPSFTDSGFALTAGCFVCGFSVLIESKRRRREMSLYVLPRAVYTMINLIMPKYLSRGATGEFLTNWLERLIFAASTGVVTTATLYKRDLVSGLIRGIVQLCVGPVANWK